jgi:hypothetical protein
MNAFLDSLKSDLLDRRLRPIVALLGVALLGALAYAVLAGGSSTSAPSASASAPVAKASGIAVSEVKTDSATPVAETTSGSAEQTGGATRNPFAPVSGLKSANSASSTSTAAAGSSPTSASGSGSGSAASGSPTSSGSESGSGSGSGSSSGSSGSEGSSSESGSSTQGGGTSPSGKSPKTAKPQTIYRVSVLFGAAAPGTPPLSAGLTPYENLTRQQPLPSATQPLVVFRGVIAGGKSATFTLVGEAILRGSAACLPSASQCQAIDLKPGQSEELEYVPLGGAAVAYQLQVVKITPSKATASAARRAFHGESKTGLELLRNDGLAALPGLRYSGAKGVLVFAAKHAFAARAHAAVWGAAFKG